MTRKEEQLVMVVKREKLFEKEYFQGFLVAEKTNFKSKILNNFEYIKRREAEENKNYKQPIGYIVLVNKKTKTIFAYQRANKNEDYTEKRLQGKWSFGVGGHVDKEDEKEKDPIDASILREIKEEIRCDIGEMRIIGYINDDSNSVGEVHFGILYMVEVFGDITPKDNEIKTSKMMTLKELNEISLNPSYTIEDWSKISLEALRNLL